MGEEYTRPGHTIFGLILLEYFFLLFSVRARGLSLPPVRLIPGAADNRYPVLTKPSSRVPICDVITSCGANDIETAGSLCMAFEVTGSEQDISHFVELLRGPHFRVLD